jgi:NitT/TauT family transport system ATP-binding protein
MSTASKHHPEFTVRSEPPAGAAVTLHGIAHDYRTDSGAIVRAVEGVNLAIGRGEFIVLVGPTGCGKTTLLNIAAGLDRPTAGRVTRAVEVRPGDTMPCVFQHYTLLPWRTLHDNVAFGPRLHGAGRRKAQAIAREWIERVGLSGFEHSRPHELSGGMRQRGAIAQALAVDPTMVLMDEPFGALDDATRRDLQRMLIGLRSSSGLTVLFVTHNLDEAIAMGDRVVVMGGRPGRVIDEVNIDLPRPRDPLSKGFTNLFVHLRTRLEP